MLNKLLLHHPPHQSSLLSSFCETKQNPHGCWSPGWPFLLFLFVCFCYFREKNMWHPTAWQRPAWPHWAGTAPSNVALSLAPWRRHIVLCATTKRDVSLLCCESYFSTEWFFHAPEPQAWCTGSVGRAADSPQKAYFFICSHGDLLLCYLWLWCQNIFQHHAHCVDRLVGALYLKRSRRGNTL